MGRDFFKNLPSEITANILSRLPLRIIAISKCVCKPWRNLLGSHDFAKSLLSKLKTPPALACLMPARAYDKFGSTCCTVFEVEEDVQIEHEEEHEEEEEDQNQNPNVDEEEHEDENEGQFQNQNQNFHELHYNRLTDFYIPLGKSVPVSMVGIAANGLFLLYSELGNLDNPLFIWNPLTRQYIKLCCPKQSMSFNFMLSFGFGASQISGQYKVVCINRDGSAHHVYTLGTGTWRCVEAGAASGFGFNLDGRIVCNGNLHWIVYDSTRPLLICGFDVETESFSIFSAPPAAVDESLTLELSVLRDCLSVSYAWNDEIVIWSMKEYQVEASWTIEYRLSTNGFDFDFGTRNRMESVYPIKLFKDGDILMLMLPKDINFYNRKRRLIYYSNKTGTIQQLGMIDEQLGTIGVLGMIAEQHRTIEDVVVGNHLTRAMIFTPALLSLASFGNENVISF
ncbi:putative F-box protein [Salvia divinorum]|uniref:F-box protein n=1 Tax=Salvia divinorum TaxID=28513 RepID=A0ABD1FSN9_SALDI